MAMSTSVAGEKPDALVTQGSENPRRLRLFLMVPAAALGLYLLMGILQRVNPAVSLPSFSNSAIPRSLQRDFGRRDFAILRRRLEVLQEKSGRNTYP